MGGCLFIWWVVFVWVLLCWFFLSNQLRCKFAQRNSSVFLVCSYQRKATGKRAAQGLVVVGFPCHEKDVSYLF